MALGGLTFGLFAERRPFGNDFLAHPLAVFFAAVAAALLVMRVALRRPVPDVLPERILLIGCLVGAAAFLAGNFLDTHVLALRWTSAG